MIDVRVSYKHMQVIDFIVDAIKNKRNIVIAFESKRFQLEVYRLVACHFNRTLDEV
jgi:hypothetical protein